MLEVLAVLSVSAAAGMRIALPLLVIGLLYSDRLWADFPVIGHIPPPIVLGILVVWSLLEIFASKSRVGQRFLQTAEVFFSPLVGAMLGMAVAKTTIPTEWLIRLLGVTGGLLALVLQLVQTGWFYRMQRVPMWVMFAQDILCVVLVLCAVDAPSQGGLIAMFLLWLAIRNSKDWHNWYFAQGRAGDRTNPRQQKQEPD